MIRTNGKILEQTIQAQQEKDWLNRRAEHPFLEFFLTALFFVMLIFIAAAFLFFLP